MELEFQLRREAIAGFNIRGAGEAIACRQDFWRYCTRWLSLREATHNRQRQRWPQASVWSELAAVHLGVCDNGLLRQRVRERQEAAVLAGALGYATSLAALRGLPTLKTTLALIAEEGPAYLQGRGRTFPELVRQKRLRMV